MSQHLLQLLHRVQSDPTQSRLAALLHQHSELTHTPTLSLPPPLLGAVTEQLNTYMVCPTSTRVTVHVSIPLTVLAETGSEWGLYGPLEILSTHFPIPYTAALRRQVHTLSLLLIIQYSCLYFIGLSSTLLTLFYHNLHLLRQRKANPHLSLVYTHS